MTDADKQIVLEIVRFLRDLTVKVDSIERAMIARGLLQDGERGNYAPDYYAAADGDVEAIRMRIAQS